MNKKGFTLVEILAVIVVLGLLIVIIIPTVNNLIKDSEDSLYNEQISNIVNATKQYMVEHSELLPDEDESVCISISDLIDNGVIDNDIVIDPRTKEELDGCVLIGYVQNYNQYEYSFVEQ